MKHYATADGSKLGPYRVPRGEGMGKGICGYLSSLHIRVKSRFQKLDATVE